MNYDIKDLNFDAHNIPSRWFGKGKIIWENLEPALRHIGQPSYWYILPVIVLLLRVQRRLQGFMKLTICNSQTHFPFCKIIWSQILPDNRYRDLIPYLVANEATNSSTIPSLCWGIGDTGTFMSCSTKLFKYDTHSSNNNRSIYISEHQWWSVYSDTSSYPTAQLAFSVNFLYFTNDECWIVVLSTVSQGTSYRSTVYRLSPDSPNVARRLQLAAWKSGEDQMMQQLLRHWPTETG